MMLRTRALVLAVVLACGATSVLEAKGNGLAIGGEGCLYLAASIFDWHLQGAAGLGVRL
jgi:hypothetical protein